MPLLVLVVMLGSTLAAEWYFVNQGYSKLQLISGLNPSVFFVITGIVICGGTFLLLLRFAASREDYVRKLAALEEQLEKANARITSRNAALETSVSGRDKELSDKVAQLEQSRTAMVSLLDDLTQSREVIEGARAFDDAVFSSISDGLLVLDTKGNITRTNASALTLNGLSPAVSVMGQSASDVYDIVDESGASLPRDQRPAVQLLALGGAAKPRHVTNLQLRRKDGVIVPVDIEYSPVIKGGELIALVILFRDVTEQRRVDRAKSEFVSLASHQLRTPLTAIGWYAELLIAEAQPKLNEQEMEYVREIDTANRRMINLVDSLLNVSRIEMGHVNVQPEPVDMAAFIHDELTVFAPQVAAKNITFHTSLAEDAPRYAADPKLLTIILQNLMSNAIRYSRPNGTIRVEFDYRDGVYSITVEDNGIGIPKAAHAKIFDKLFRADNARLIEAEGSGLGLYLVKSIVDQIGGKITFTSDEEKGSTFTVIFPKGGMKLQAGTKTVIPSPAPVGVVPSHSQTYAG